MGCCEWLHLNGLPAQDRVASKGRCNPEIDNCASLPWSSGHLGALSRRRQASGSGIQISSHQPLILAFLLEGIWYSVPLHLESHNPQCSNSRALGPFLMSGFWNLHKPSGKRKSRQVMCARPGTKFPPRTQIYAGRRDGCTLCTAVMLRRHSGAYVRYRHGELRGPGASREPQALISPADEGGII